MSAIILDRRTFMAACATTAFSVSCAPLLNSWQDRPCKRSDNLASMMGGGNFWNNEIPEEQYHVLDELGARAIRMAVHPRWYLEPWNDDAVIYALQQGMNILYQCEYLPSYSVPDRTYGAWFDIGRNLATRYSPGSSLLTCRGIPRSRGITRWSAINEPDTDQQLIADYRNMIWGYADGIHSANPTAKVYPGGFLSANRDAEYTGNGYIPKIVDLINNDALSGIDLHIYADKLYAPIENTWKNCAQRNFDAVVSATGICRNIDLLISEHNFKNTASGQGYDEAYVKRMMLPHIFDVLGCVHRDNTPATEMALAWNLFHQNGPEYFLTTGGTDWHQAGIVYKMVLDLLGDCYFVFNDPRATGRYELRSVSGPKYAWIFQNHHESWSTEYGPFRQIDLPFRSSLLKRYNHDGMQESVRVDTQSCARVTTPTGETSIWIAQPAFAES